MENFLQNIILVTLIVSIIMNIAVVRKILQNDYEEKLLYAIDVNHDKMVELDEKLSKLSIQIDRSMLALRDTLEPTKPMKSNNWDSIREAFKSPPRIDLNDRDSNI